MVKNSSAKNACLALTALSVLAYIIFGLPEDCHCCGLFLGCGLSQRLIYSFVHASVWHVLANAWALLVMAFVFDISLYQLFLAYIIAVTVPEAVINTVPIVGMSAVCYALCGMASLTVRHKLIYHLWFVASIALGFAFTSTAAILHAYCYAAGVIVGFLTMPLCSNR